MGLYENVKEAADFLIQKAGQEIEFGLVLGSGLGELAERVEDATSLAFGEIPHFPSSTVQGHKGRLVIGTLKGKKWLSCRAASMFTRATHSAKPPYR